MNRLVLGNKEFFDIKNIVFDLGGIVINIDYYATIEGFKKIGFVNFNEIYSQMRQAHVFDNYDKGLILPSEFRNELRNMSGATFTDVEFDSAWNAMILDLPLKRVETLKKLSKYFKNFLLSNTNEIHLEYFFNYVNSVFGHGVFESLFEKPYYSCRMGMRKPDLEIYHKVINDSRLTASETLFIDDTAFNVDAAIEAGMQGYYLNKQEDIVELFKNYLV